MGEASKHLDDSFRRSDLLCFGEDLAARLDGGKLRYDGDRQASAAGVLSLLPFSKIELPCRIDIPLNWKSRRPSVTCTAGWIRQELHWHVYDDGSLCYVLPPEWRDRLLDISSRHVLSETIDYASQYLLRNVKWLLQHHWEGHRQGISEWQWPEWRHGDVGPRQYRGEQHRARRAAA